MAISAALWKSLRAYQVYGANTDVGKTVVSTLLCNAVNQCKKSRTSAFLKPVSTGPLDKADNEYGRAPFPPSPLGMQDGPLTFGHVRHIRRYAPGTLTRCLFQFDKPVSPHIAARLKDSIIPQDNDILGSIHKTLCEWNNSNVDFALVETAGGVHSPGPNGNSQADLYRPLRLPIILVADPRLGGISSSIASYESLLLRGYDITSVLVFKDDYYRNYDFLRDYFRKKHVPLASLPPPPERPLVGETDANAWDRDRENMGQYYEHVSAHDDVSKIIDGLETQHTRRIERLKEMPRKAHETIWYPFTQHYGIQPTGITPIDSAYGDYFQTFKNNRKVNQNQLKASFDGSASWWTQGLGHGNPELSLAAAYAAGRFGHVMFPGNIHEPALALAESLINKLGNPRLGKVFYSDDGSTGMEVAVKMGLRAAGERYGWDASKEQINILGLKGSYHGDTIGAMDCAEPSIYNKKVEWYRGRGFWFDFPQVSMSQGIWKVSLPAGLEASTPSELQFASLDQIFDVNGRLSSRAVREYSEFIYEKLREVTSGGGMKFGALLMEPIILGAGGMLLCDPLFQRCLVDVVRSHPELFGKNAKPIENPPQHKWSGLPVIFDEVFTGLYRLGRMSAGSFLKVDPDVTVNAKLLTGGLVPLCTTAASNEIFEVFLSPDKTGALLHGHSYTAHPVGCQVAIESLKIMTNMEANGQWDPHKSDWGQQTSPHDQAQQPMGVWSMWSHQLVADLSHNKLVDGVFSIGSVLAIHLRDETGKGYASNAAHTFQQKLLAAETINVHARVLGNVLYLMCSMTSRQEELRYVEQLVRESLS
ncbi:hypothetical protein KEM54_003206 [Ascosphaera aggregata]|nr:hypothetical protein KEM54_003206 [Ascosphaera aggregata]